MKKYLLLLFLIATASVAFGQNNSKIAPELQGYTGSQQIHVVVQYAPGTQVNCSGLLGLVDCLVNDILKLGGQLLAPLPLVNGVLASLDGSAISTLSNNANVVYISSDRPLTPTLSNAAPAINAPYAWQSGYTGAGIGIALIDSGVNGSADLNGGFLGLSRVVYSQSFVPGNTSTGDQYGHGTHIAGLIAGNGANSTGLKYSKTFKGIAPQANLINLRVLDQNGAGTDSAVIAAIAQAISLKSSYNIRVINLSLGRAIYESYKLDPLCLAVEAAWKNGIVVVVAAGNNGRYLQTNGYATISAPGNDPYVITVGAMKPMGTPTRTDDLIASYSSKGPTAIDAIAKPDIVAPGNLLVSLEAQNSTLYNEYPGSRVPYSFYVNGGSSSPSSNYFVLSGTSMATGVVSGAVADLLKKTPSLTPDQVKARLMKTAYKTFPQYSSVTDPSTGITYTDQYDIFTVGAGYIDLQAALQNSSVASGTAMSPSATYNSGDVYLSDDPSSVWNTSSTWANSAIWGSTEFATGAPTMNGSNALWGANAVWGSNALWGANALWGSNALWGANALWGSNALWGANFAAGEQ